VSTATNAAAIDITAAPSTWNLDASHTLVEFAAKHMMITTVKGRFVDVRGAITLDPRHPEASSVEVEFAAASLDTRSEQRDQHLRSADFLDVEKFPVVSFKSRRIEGARAEAGRSFRVIGDLTIRGVTREVTLDTVYEGQGRDPWGNERVSFSATAKFDRRDFGLTWNAALETGGVLVSNDIKITIEAQAIRA
jgi:polyisoprenoid-binding protein YceI